MRKLLAVGALALVLTGCGAEEPADGSTNSHVDTQRKILEGEVSERIEFQHTFKDGTLRKKKEGKT